MKKSPRDTAPFDWHPKGKAIPGQFGLAAMSPVIEIAPKGYSFANAVIRTAIYNTPIILTTDDIMQYFDEKFLNPKPADAAESGSTGPFSYFMLPHVGTTGGMCVFPTGSKEVTYPPVWHGKLQIYAEKLVIDRGENIDLWCTSEEGLTCPTFHWNVSGTGFYLGEIGSKTGMTNQDFEVIHLLADNTACGTATITVTDNCGESDTANVNCTAGRWKLVSTGVCELPGSVGFYDYELWGGSPVPRYGRFYFQLISGYMKQEQETLSKVDRPYSYDEAVSGCNSFKSANCSGDDNCIDGYYPGAYYEEVQHYAPDGEYACFCVEELRYYEWECAP